MDFQKQVMMEANFENSIIHKPCLGLCKVPQKIWARSVFGHTQTDRQAKYIYRLGF